MSTNFLSLPGELRNKIYKQLLVDEEPIDPWHYQWMWHGAKPLTSEILRVNKTIHYEASSMLYAHNRFNLTNFDSELVISFLDQIGRNNAGHIRQICINFPIIRDVGDILKDNSDDILEKIQSDCTNLRTLITSLESTSKMVLNLEALGNPKAVGETLALTDARFRAISTIEEIIVEVYKDYLTSDVRNKMENHGWKINEIEAEKESDHDWSFSDYNYDYGYEHEYDIDNDSDFWRRAAD